MAAVDGAADVLVPRRRAVPSENRQGPVAELVKLAPGRDGALIETCTTSGARDLVIEAFGVGNANDAVVAARCDGRWRPGSR